MTSQPLIFATAFEPLIKLSKGKMSEATTKKLVAMRVALPLEPAYSPATWAETVRLISAELHPAMTPVERHRQLGRETALLFADGLMGKAMYAAARLMGPRRSLERMTRSLQTGTNFIETRYTARDERTSELWMSDTSGLPEFYAGVMTAGGEMIGGWPALVDVISGADASATYVFRFT